MIFLVRKANRGWLVWAMRATCGRERQSFSEEKDRFVPAARCVMLIEHWYLTLHFTLFIHRTVWLSFLLDDGLYVLIIDLTSLLIQRIDFLERQGSVYEREASIPCNPLAFPALAIFTLFLLLLFYYFNWYECPSSSLSIYDLFCYFTLLALLLNFTCVSLALHLHFTCTFLAIK